MTRERLRKVADASTIVGIVFIALAVIGSIIIGVIAAPETVSRDVFDNVTREKNVGAGIGIGVGAFVGSLVTILPYFLFAVVMRGVAELLPESEPLDATSSGRRRTKEERARIQYERLHNIPHDE